MNERYTSDKIFIQGLLYLIPSVIVDNDADMNLAGLLQPLRIRSLPYKHQMFDSFHRNPERPLLKLLQQLF